MRYLLFLIMLLPAICFSDVSGSLSWDSPTERDDGSPLAESDISEYRVYRTPDILIYSGLSESIPITIPSGETHIYTAATVDVNGVEGSRSAPVSISAVGPKPITLIFILNQGG